MAGNETELCASCLRDSEEEGAEFWCTDCMEPLCRGCGKVHRRFANPHGVINLKDVLRLSKNIPKNCKHHEDQNLGFFCVSHDKIICHQCVTENHKNCKNIMPIEKAAKNVKESTSIDDLTKRMTNIGAVSKQVKIKTEEKLQLIHDEKQKADESFIKLEQCVQTHLTRIKNDLETRYLKTVNTMESNREALSTIHEKLTENTEDLNAIKESTNEKHIFNTVKFLDELQLNDEKSITGMQKDIITEPLDIITTSFTAELDRLFTEMNKASSQNKKGFSDIILAANKVTQLQAEKSYEIRSDHKKKPYKDLKSEKDCTYHESCFTEDGKIVIVEKKLTYETSFSGRKYERITYNIIINDIGDQHYMHDSMYTPRRIELYSMPTSICMYDKTLALISSNNHLTVIDTNLLAKGRTISFKSVGNIDNPTECTLVSCKGRQIWVLGTFETEKRLIFSVDLNGTITRILSFGDSVSSIDFDGANCFICSYKNNNEIKCITMGESVRFRYASLDLRENCQVLHIQANYIYVLEKESNTIYNVDVAKQSRTVLKRGNISRPSFFSLNSQGNQLAVTMEDGKLIRIFNL